MYACETTFFFHNNLAVFRAISWRHRRRHLDAGVYPGLGAITFKSTVEKYQR